MSNRLAGKTALISGGASGIGAACAKAFVAEGANVLLADVAQEAGEALARRINAEAGREAALFQPLDVTQPAMWRDAVARAEQAFGRLNLLVSNAGVCSMAGLLDETEETWSRVVAVNQTGVWLGMRAVVPAMQRAGAGAIVNISSIWGMVGVAGATAYQGTKGAVVLLGKAAAAELVAHRIRVNTILPGIVDTPFLAVLTTEQRAGIAGLSLMKREGRPVEIANAAVFLASDEAAYVTGTELVVDGGYTTC